MAVSQNGYPANDQSLTDVYTVPGSKVRLRLRKGPCARALLLVAEFVDQHVEDIDTRTVKGYDVPDDWSFAERRIRGGQALSNHASGTAIDLNAVQHPLGVEGTWSAAQRDAVHGFLRRLTDPRTGRQVVRWGEDYSSRKDGMHFEINADEDAVRRALDAFEEGADMPLSGDDLKKISEIIDGKLAALEKRLWHSDHIDRPASWPPPEGKTDPQVHPASALARLVERLDDTHAIVRTLGASGVPAADVQQLSAVLAPAVAAELAKRLQS